MQFVVRTDFRAAYRAIESLPAALRDRVMARVLNRTAEIAKTRASREIRQEYNLRAVTVRQRLAIQRARARPDGLEVALIARGSRPGKRAMNVTAFDARQTKRGATVKIKRRGPRKIPRPPWAIHAPFILPVAGRPVVARFAPGRNKLRGVQTIDVPQIFNARRINNALLATIRDRLPAIADHELRQAIAGRFR